jgi:hypothetical protein
VKWLFLVHQVHTPHSRERVKVWRAIKKTGAVLYRNSVYVLPFSKERLEDFQWVCQQINDSKGEASIFTSYPQSEKEDVALRALFRKTREADYEALQLSAERLLHRIHVALRRKALTRRLRKSLGKEAEQIQDAFEDLQKIDFFSNSPPKRVTELLRELYLKISSTQKLSEIPPPIKNHSKAEFQRKIWATRAGIHIDRLCSAWLIRRFIDPAARFIFAAESSLPQKAILFDVFGAVFGHHGEDCTFEVLIKTFGIQDPALQQIAEIIHDIDLKDHKFGRTEASGLDIVIRSLAQSSGDDHQLLKLGSVILDALYRSFSERSFKR